MSTPSVGPSTRDFAASSSQPRSKSQTTDAQASATERDAQGRITAAAQSVETAQLDANKELDQIRDQYAERSELETTNLEDAIERQKLKGYEQLRDLKRAQEQELHRTKVEGDRDLSQAQNYYRDTSYSTFRKGEEDVKDLREKQAQETQYIGKSGQLDETMSKTEQERKLADLKAMQEHQYSELNNQRIAQYEKLKEDTAAANQRATEHFQTTYASTIKQDQTAMDLVDTRAAQQLGALREETSQKLGAYGSRQSDPFYKLKDIGGALHEYGDKFVYTAHIPRHEQDHIAVALRANSLVVTGSRRNEEKLEVSPGHTKGTSSYQSFEESVPLDWPVEGRLLSKEFHGDTMVITIPKASEFASKGVYKAPSPPRLRAERPQFPGNLPTPETVKDETAPEKSSGGRPLT